LLINRNNIIRLLLIIIIGLTTFGVLFPNKWDIGLGSWNLARGSDSLLGMKLGLDLQGGSHLVYQARGSKNIEIQFDETPTTTSINKNLVIFHLANLLDPDQMDFSLGNVDGNNELDVTLNIKKDSEIQTLANYLPGIESRLQYRLTNIKDMKFIQASDEDLENMKEFTFSIIFSEEDQKILLEQIVSEIFSNLGSSNKSVRASNGDSVNITTELSSRTPDQDKLRKELELYINPTKKYLITDIPATPNVNQMEGVVDIINRRVNPYGVSEPIIQSMDGDKVLVQLPGLNNVEEVKTLIGRTAQLRFVERTCLENYRLVANGQEYFPCDVKENQSDQETGLTGDDLDRAYVGTHPQTGAPIVNVEFDSEGTKVFAELTTKISATRGTATPDRFVVFLDDEEIVAPGVSQPILGGSAFIEGPTFTFDRVNTIAIQLESGRLPVPLELISELSVDATLGAESLSKSLSAGVVGLLLVLLFMVLYYRLAGVIAALSLILYTALVLSLFKLIPITLTLAGLAGFILSIGMAVDANILIFERTKEELRLGRTLLSSIDIGFNRAWSAIRDASISTLITSAVLIWFGQRLGATTLAGVGTTLSIGVLVSLFTSVFVSKVLLQIISVTFLGKWKSLFSSENIANTRG
jgi:preprotein translocase subunit SecD